jgi:hypothetical protein
VQTAARRRSAACARRAAGSRSSCCRGRGVTLVELVAGARPFAGENPWVLRDAIRAGAALDGLAPDLAAIAARALAFEPGDRYRSVDALRRDVAAAQRRRAPATAIDLGDWVRARITAP